MKQGGYVRVVECQNGGIIAAAAARQSGSINKYSVIGSGPKLLVGGKLHVQRCRRDVRQIERYGIQGGERTSISAVRVGGDPLGIFDLGPGGIGCDDIRERAI